MKTLLRILTIIICFINYGQETRIPEWFLNDVKQMHGTWIADNSEYKSEHEPYISYINEWTPGIDNQSLTGKLYGKMESGKRVLFWEFRQYWDNESQEAKVLQFGSGNVLGQGSMYPIKDEIFESIQIFSLPDGSKWTEKHQTSIQHNILTTTSFELQTDETWKKKRTYRWIKQNPLNLGIFSMSLNVKDLKKSKEFYEVLGFEVVDGKIEQNWLVLKNKDIKIGLFKGMFQSNTITFNAKDARTFYELLLSKKVPVLFQQGMDNDMGACSFSFLDPDGNPILIDQH